MAIFGVLEADLVCAVDDRIRISAKKTYVSKDEAAVTLVEIEPEAGNGFVDVTGSSSEDWFLDWQFATDGDPKVISLRVTTDGLPVTFTKDITVLTEAEDMLFSKDEDLYLHESELIDFLPEGRNSWKYVHRRVQTLILDWFDEQNLRDINGNRLTKAAFLENDEVRKWSEAWVLSLIYTDLSNTVGDKFEQKATQYNSLAIDARRRSGFRYDFDGSGTVEDGEFARIQTIGMSRQ